MRGVAFACLAAYLVHPSRTYYVVYQTLESIGYGASIAVLLLIMGMWCDALFSKAHFGFCNGWGIPTENGVAPVPANMPPNCGHVACVSLSGSTCQRSPDHHMQKRWRMLAGRFWFPLLPWRSSYHPWHSAASTTPRLLQIMTLDGSSSRLYFGCGAEMQSFDCHA